MPGPYSETLIYLQWARLSTCIFVFGIPSDNDVPSGWKKSL